MAFEDMTYEALNARMMERVVLNYPELDTREGSMVFQAVAAAAMELSIAYEWLDSVLDQSFVETASRESLLRLCRQVGMDITEFNATYGKFKGVFNLDVPLGSRWNLGQYNYSVLEYIGYDDTEDLYEFSLLCETAGSGPNALSGDITPVEYINGNITTAKITECLVPGEEEATDEEIKTEYTEYVTHDASNGNKSQYIEWAESFDGIGNTKVFPLWNGVGTVKVSILNADNEPATNALILDFQNYLDPGIEGLGNGVAPIGAKVTVSTASRKTITAAANVKLKEGYDSTDGIDSTITDYFKTISYERDNVPYMNVGSVIVNMDSVDFITGLTLNGGTADIPLGDEEIPVLGTTTWTVVN